MKKHLHIDLNSLPDDGKTFSGELDGSIFSAHGEDIKAKGPMYYDLYVQKFDSELLVRGNLSASFDFTCDRCLKHFTQTISADDISLCVEISSPSVDLADSLREEIVVLFPDYPHCNEGDEDLECNIDYRYLAVDKTPIDEVKTPSHDASPNPWDALDALDDKNPPSAN